MKSPISGKEMKLSNERRKLNFRKEDFDLNSLFYLCEDSGEKFTSTELDEVNLLQVYNQYRDKYNIPFPSEIKEIRLKYNLSAKKMSEILGFGVNGYRNYESGEMPSISNGRIIQLINDPEKFHSLLVISDSLIEKKKLELIDFVEKMITNQKKKIFHTNVESYLMKNGMPNIYTGYVKPNLLKLAEMIIFFTERASPFKTKLNKLLFYSDFLAFRSTCFSISGLKYRAIQLGPVPYNFQSIFEYLSNSEYVNSVICNFGDGMIGEKFTPNKSRVFNPELFSKEELDVLHLVAKKFEETSTADIIEITHKEKAWLQNKENRSLISYNYAFELSQM